MQYCNRNLVVKFWNCGITLFLARYKLVTTNTSPGLWKTSEREIFAEFLQFKSSGEKWIFTSFRFTSDEIAPRMCMVFEACITTQGSHARINCARSITSLKWQKTLTSCDANVGNYVKECLKLVPHQIHMFVPALPGAFMVWYSSGFSASRSDCNSSWNSGKHPFTGFEFFPMLSKVFVAPWDQGCHLPVHHRPVQGEEPQCKLQ